MKKKVKKEVITEKAEELQKEVLSLKALIKKVKEEIEKHNEKKVITH